MEFLVLWLGTIVASFGLEIANELRMLKDVADAGYKINMERLSEIHKQINQDVPNATLQSMLIPVFVEPTLTELHISSVCASACGIDLIKSSSLLVIPFDTTAE